MDDIGGYTFKPPDGPTQINIEVLPLAAGHFGSASATARLMRNGFVTLRLAVVRAGLERSDFAVRRLPLIFAWK